MGQVEVFEVLKKQRLTGNHNYFSVREIENLMKNEGYTNGCITKVRVNLIMLEQYDYVEYKSEGVFRSWKFFYRVKDKYVDGVKNG